MGSYILQRELYYDRAIELRSTGLSYRRISKIISVPKEILRKWYINFAASNKSTLQYSMKNKVQEDNQISEKGQSLPFIYHK